MKKIIVIFLLLFSHAFAKDWQQIYEELEPADFEYIHGIDPFQAEDYTKYIWSPYPLLRTSSTFYFKKHVIEPGYYLLTPREKNGKEWVLFKQQGKVKFVIPVYKKELVPVNFYENNLPKPVKSGWQKFWDGAGNLIGKMFKKSTMRTPPPDAYIDSENLTEDFVDIILYYGNHKYHMIFSNRKL